ncbi:hypothetical protein [Streptomyces sp. NPDC047046]|uniref:hypothetical protein n=1 Tax=Streptomyces sp. NPDC047046 TaxID=3155378 RepID=UPI0033E9E6CE
MPAAELAALDDTALSRLLATSTPLAAGIGGRTARLDVAGTPVFVKRVPLTAREAERESTADPYGLPLVCHYGMGASPAGGAWRELEAHRTAERLGVAPRLYHWRLLREKEPPRLPDELTDTEAVSRDWGPEAALRIRELRDSPASLALFMEYVPQTLHDWLGPRLRGAGGERDVARVARQLDAAARKMSAHGLVHFDGHWGNVLTDGRRVLFTDFGLALADTFALTARETAFLAEHREHDLGYARSFLVNWLLTQAYGLTNAERHAYVRAPRPLPEPGPGAALLARDAPLTAVLTPFLVAVAKGARDTPYPAAELARTLRP